MEIRPFHAFRTRKVHVVIFSFHATHFHTLLTTLQFRYVNARFRHPVYHATHFQTLLATPPLPVCRTIGKSWYCSQSPNFGCLCALIGSEVYSIVTYSLSGNSLDGNSHYFARA